MKMKHAKKNPKTSKALRKGVSTSKILTLGRGENHNQTLVRVS